jgi:hypothetical protein
MKSTNLDPIAVLWLVGVVVSLLKHLFGECDLAKQFIKKVHYLLDVHLLLVLIINALLL